LNSNHHIKEINVPENSTKYGVLEVKEKGKLLEFLLASGIGISRNKLKSLLAHKLISVNGTFTTHFDYPLDPGDKVKINKNTSLSNPQLPNLKIIYEDEFLIVIQKNPGLLSIATDKERESTAFSILSNYVKLTDARNKIFVVHRLDKDASGLMMFAKSEQVQEILQSAWQEIVEERNYVVVVEGEVEEQEGTISNWLLENKNLVMYSTDKPGEGQQAITHYRVLEIRNGWSLLEVSLETGRKNQIRVHMKDLGHPIAGDKKYGATGNPIHRLALHAQVLRFKHPISNQSLHFKTAIPPEFLKLLSNKPMNTH
jgi:23S rRNA pseudouridine1911/1915/1917 synthase